MKEIVVSLWLEQGDCFGSSDIFVWFTNKHAYTFIFEI